MKAWALAAVALATLGCKELPDIPAGVCGNHVIEPPEDCDGFEREGVPCRPPGSVAECRLDCAPNELGVAATCPNGWGCFEDRVCRPATGELRDTRAPIPGYAQSLLTGDFDGDGHDDVVGLERPLTLGITKGRIHYFDAQARHAATYVSGKLVASPTVSDITNDRRSDLVYSYGSIFALAGVPSRSLLQETYPSYFLGSSPARAVFVSDGLVDRQTALAVFTRLDSTDGIFVSEPDSPVLRAIVELPLGVDALAADPLAADLLEDEAEFPCDELAVAYHEDAELTVYSLCESYAADGTARWRDAAYAEIVRLEPPARIDRGIVAADIDGDGHLDLLIGTTEGAYVAYGNGRELGTAGPFSPILVNSGAELGTMPLAAGDMTGDGIADLLFPRGLAISTSAPDSGDPIYVAIRPRFGEPWSEARFGDVNGDGKLDLACASNAGLDIEVFVGTGTEAVNSFTVPTERPTEHLVIRDFDGDLVNDVAFVELRSPSIPTERLSIAFGRTSGGPEDPVAGAELENIDQIDDFSDDPTSTLGNLIVVFSQTDDESEEYAIGLIAGSSDRSLASPIQLSTFAADGDVQTSTSVALTVGAFQRPDQTDVLPFALAPSPDGYAEASPELWLIGDITAKNRGPQKLGWDLDPRTRPIGGPNGATSVSARLTAGDLDGDRVDELVFVAPGDDGASCIVNVAGVVEDPPVLDLDDVVTLDMPCYETAVDVLDVDFDGAPEILLLAGDLALARSLLVLWNDGTGDFSSDQALSVAVEGESPNAFAPFHASDGTLRLAYVTDDTVRSVRPLGASRVFEDAGVVGTVERGTGIVGADVDGDGIDDLAVADSGSIRVFHAELSP